MRGVLFTVVMLSLASLSCAEFVLESVHVTVRDIQPDGSAKVEESIKLLVKGDLSQALYDSGLKTSNDLSRWSANIGLSDIKQHVNPGVVVISDFGLQPQPRTGCNPFLETCHGELKMVYSVAPVYNNSVPIAGTGLFQVDDYKPRTERYSLNPEALSFTPTEGGSTLLGPDVWFSIELPQGSDIIEVNPSTTATENAPSGTVLSWSDMVLVRLSVVFDVEESIDKEVEKFFSDSFRSFQATLNSQHGIAFLAVLGILVGSYVYITIAKKKKEE